MIYMDSAATTLQKPPAVARAMVSALKHCASLGRGGHKPAMLSADTAFACRQAAAELCHVSDPENVIFTMNAIRQTPMSAYGPATAHSTAVTMAEELVIFSADMIMAPIIITRLP